MCYLNDFQFVSMEASVSLYKDQLLGVGFGTSTGERVEIAQSATNICTQYQEFCMSALWLYLSNSNSLVLESLYHKRYAITEIVDLTHTRDKEGSASSPSLSQYTSVYMICISMYVWQYIFCWIRIWMIKYNTLSKCTHQYLCMNLYLFKLILGLFSNILMCFLGLCIRAIHASCYRVIQRDLLIVQ